jgi:hypothetical protein
MPDQRELLDPDVLGRELGFHGVRRHQDRRATRPARIGDESGHFVVLDGDGISGDVGDAASEIQADLDPVLDPDERHELIHLDTVQDHVIEAAVLDRRRTDDRLILTGLKAVRAGLDRHQSILERLAHEARAPVAAAPAAAFEADRELGALHEDLVAFVLEDVLEEPGDLPGRRQGDAHPPVRRVRRLGLRDGRRRQRADDQQRGDPGDEPGNDRTHRITGNAQKCTMFTSVAGRTRV